MFLIKNTEQWGECLGLDVNFYERNKNMTDTNVDDMFDVVYRLKLVDDVKKISDEYSNVLDMVLDARVRYLAVLEEVRKRLNIRNKVAVEMKNNGNPKPADDLQRDEDKIWNLTTAVFNKSRQVSGR